MNLKQLSNRSLVEHLKESVARERAALSDLLRYLREMEERQLYLELGFSSLFAYCTTELGYSEPEAQVRIQAMRLTRAVPETEKHLEEGKLSLSVAAEAQGCFRREEKARSALPQKEKRAA